ncbi:MAG: hypothetical protein LBQ93_04135 [Treponema sp.]|jgi:excinuclease UvrABC helicase subunit UvrB|nr:hypothetical protein [Treponema sp.]
MNRSNSSASFILPGEYRKAAERLFPKDGFLRRQKTDMKAAAEFAKSLGIGAEYQRVLELDKNSEELRTYLEYFQNNLDLLIQKTWVEKSEERRKRKLQEDIPSFMIKIEQRNFPAAIEEFSAIMEELAYLFFGDQRKKDDFTEYTFRIDAQMGLFWWYVSRLVSLKELTEKNNDWDEKFLWAVLLPGICYLTNF